MNLSPKADAKLKAWYGTDTWHTPHDLDMNRWFEFVNQHQQDNGFTVDEAGLREHIEYEIKELGRSMSVVLSETIGKRISLMHHILDFLKQTGR